MTARSRITKSLQALIAHVDAGGIQDTALPGTSTAEATRLLKNGLSVTAFACFEHFVRGRIAELLELVSSAPKLPPFSDLPEGLQVAATKGAIDAVRFRLNLRTDTLDTSSVVAIAQQHSQSIASSSSAQYMFSEWSFGWASSNIGAGTLKDFLQACGAQKLYDEIGAVLRDVAYDFSTAGLAENGNLKLSRIAGWRHEAAHDATASIDVELLHTRILAYLAIAFSFDTLASFACQSLVDSFDQHEQPQFDRSSIKVSQLKPDGEQFSLIDSSGQKVNTLYSVSHCQDTLIEQSTPKSGVVVVRDSYGQLVDWFFH